MSALPRAPGAVAAVVAEPAPGPGPAQHAAPTAAPTAAPWRHASVVLGAAVGLLCSFQSVFSAALPFFMLPWQQEFGWGRGEISAATVLSMLGVTVASPFVGRLFDRFGTERVIAVCVLLMAAAVYAVSRHPGQLLVLAALCFVVGVFGAGTSMVGYLGVLPRWFDRRLGLALGLAGLGGGVGIGLAPFVATRLVQQAGWRGALAVLAGIALVGGLLAFALIRPRRGDPVASRAVPVQGAVPPAKPSATVSASGVLTAIDAGAGLTVSQAWRQRPFWLLLATTFLVPLSILGIALHGVALFMDRGLSAQQAATGAALAGGGAVLARIGVGALLDRWQAPAVAAVVFLAAGVGLAMNSVATSFWVLCLGSFLGGVAMGAEGDLLPYMLRRYFGLKAFGSLFGLMFAAYALGGVLGPVVYGVVVDRVGSYTPTMLAGALACAASALAITRMGAYRFGVASAAGPVSSTSPDSP